jgi:Kef-type K+ transport system membrane component KefB
MAPIFTLLIQIVIVVTVARAVGSIVGRAGQPRVVGEMLAGLLLGPSLFGRFAPGAAAWVFPSRSLELLNVFSIVGLVLYMLLVGVRMDAAHLSAKGRLVLTTSVASILIPFGIGIALALAIVPQFSVPASSRLAFVLFIGLSLSITAFPVLVRIVAEHGLESTHLGTVALAAASFNDVIAWAALAFVTSLAVPSRTSIGTTLLLLAAYGALMAMVVGPLLRRQLRRQPHRDARFALIVIAALASAAVTEWIGIHPLFGSFFLGVLLSGDDGIGELLTERIEPITVTLLLPLFFAFTGLRTNVNLLPSAGLLAEAALIVLLAVVGKAIAPAVIARTHGFSWRESLSLGALMNTRGLVELVVLNIGVDSGLLSPTLFTMLALMAFVTTAMTSPLLTALGFGRAHAARSRRTSSGTTSRPGSGMVQGAR